MVGTGRLLWTVKRRARRPDPECPLWRSVAEEDWVVAGFDLSLWALAILHALAAVRIARHGSKVARA